MKKLIIAIIIVMMIPVMGICNERVYLGNDPTPHAKWVRERDNYTIVYTLKNLLEKDEARRKAIIEESKKQKIIEAQDKKERIQL